MFVQIARQFEQNSKIHKITVELLANTFEYNLGELYSVVPKFAKKILLKNIKDKADNIYAPGIKLDINNEATINMLKDIPLKEIPDTQIFA